MGVMMEKAKVIAALPAWPGFGFLAAPGVGRRVVMKAFYNVITLSFNSFKILWRNPVFKAALALSLWGWLLWAGGLRLNVTGSLPPGLYRALSASASAAAGFRRGDLAGFCLESGNPYAGLARERGYVGPGACPFGLKPLLKMVAGRPGDRVEISVAGLAVNGRFLPGTARPARDGRGRPLPPSLLQAGEIPEGFALMLSFVEGGFDGRHFGLTPLSDLRLARPLWTWGDRS